MECPYCKKQMQLGYTNCHNGVFSITWKSNDNPNDTAVIKKEGAWFSTKVKDIYYCKNCDIIIKKLNNKK